MKKILLYVAILFLSLMIMGCSTIMTGTVQQVTVNSNIHNAKVYVDGTYRGETPLTLDLATKKNYNIRIEAEGYIPYTEVIRKKASGWAWGNMFLWVGGIIGIGVDMLTGGLYIFEKDNISGQLSPIKVGQLEPIRK